MSNYTKIILGAIIGGLVITIVAMQVKQVKLAANTSSASYSASNPFGARGGARATVGGGAYLNNTSNQSNQNQSSSATSNSYPGNYNTMSAAGPNCVNGADPNSFQITCHAGGWSQECWDACPADPDRPNRKLCIANEEDSRCTSFMIVD